MPAVLRGDLVNDALQSPGNPDIVWLQERCTRRVRP
jgi:hypothetical protein